MFLHKFIHEHKHSFKTLKLYMENIQVASAHKQFMTTWVKAVMLFVLSLSIQTVFGGQSVKYLPGYDGELPFNLETGYVSVGDSELFYYFIESEGNSDNDPLVLWLTGGPGCSSFSSLISEVGPLEYDTEYTQQNGGLPKLRYYPYGRTKFASMIFLDSPVGTGFSYSRTQEGWPSSDTKAAEQAHQFLRNWLVENPKYLSVEIFVAGSSYSGIPVPLVVKNIVNGNKERAKPYINIKGYFMGSPVTTSFSGNIDIYTKLEFAHGMALISDKIYESAKRSCNNDFLQMGSANAECKSALAALDMCLEDLNPGDTLAANCNLLPPNIPCRRSLNEGIAKSLVSPSPDTIDTCDKINIKESSTWGNDESVKEALHVREGTKPRWKRCNGTLSYEKDYTNVIPVHRELSRFDLKVLIESGDHDLMVPYTTTLKWIKSLNLSLVDGWRPWFIDDQVRGYTEMYAKDGFQLSFINVKGAGHLPPVGQRKGCYDMFDRWIHDRPI